MTSSNYLGWKKRKSKQRVDQTSSVCCTIYEFKDVEETC
ncbi:hypothetical protein Nmel_000672 [Mimus melanotis]